METDKNITANFPPDKSYTGCYRHPTLPLLHGSPQPWPEEASLEPGSISNLTGHIFNLLLLFFLLYPRRFESHCLPLPDSRASRREETRAAGGGGWPLENLNFSSLPLPSMTMMVMIPYKLNPNEQAGCSEFARVSSDI